MSLAWRRCDGRAMHVPLPVALSSRALHPPLDAGRGEYRSADDELVKP
jgi:hypothetical protein